MRRLMLGLLFGSLWSGLASAQSLERQMVQVYRQEYLAGRTLAAGQVVTCAYREGLHWRHVHYGRASCSVFARQRGQGVTVTGQADDLRVTVGPRGELTLKSPGLTTFERDIRRLFPWWVRQW